MKNQKGKIGIIFIIIIAFVLGFSMKNHSLENAKTNLYTKDSIFYVSLTNQKSHIDTTSVSAITSPKNITSTSASINATTINGMTLDFTKPGQKGTYKVYAYNSGKLDAYLKSIIAGKITCTPGEGTTPELVNKACNDITLTIKVGTTHSTSTKDMDGSIPKVNHHQLKSNTSEEVEVIVEYPKNGANSNGAFTVILPTISLTYYSTDE